MSEFFHCGHLSYMPFNTWDAFSRKLYCKNGLRDWDKRFLQYSVNIGLNNLIYIMILVTYK